MKKRYPKILTKLDIARQLDEVIGRGRGDKDIYRSEAYKLVTLTLNSMRSAILRGEKIWINGFGIFYVKTTRPRKSAVVFHRFPRNYGTRMLISVPAKKVVRFSPSADLKRFVQEDYNDN
jgi:nucleoid DNA-binding protein